ncbi:MAG TPA: extracellular solute-binding protein [Stellaceae bacterium]|nr:extracellular solute-binding protein [Stellaceae bacterium]
MTRITRRTALKLSGAGALAAAGGGLAGILASGRAPAFAQGTTLHWLKFVDFVPVSDQLLKGKIRDDCQKALGIDLAVETINGDGVQARITSAIQAKTGPDIMMAVNNWAQLYADSLADVSDIAEARGKAENGYFETAKDVANDGKRWIAMPFTILGVLLVNRTSWFAEEGVTPDKFPKTWEQYRAVGKKMKPKGRPFGQTLAHAFGDGVAGWYPYLWSWGGKEVEADGKTVALNSKETIESVRFATAMWKDAYTKAPCHGTTPATTAPISPTRSVRRATARRSTCSPAASPTPTRPKPASRSRTIASTRRCRRGQRASSATTCRSPT